MANQWFRFYSEFLHDPKVRVMEDKYQLRLVLLLCLKCSNDKPLKDEHVAFSLRVSNEEWDITKATFIESGFITSKNEIVNWDKRQFISDSSADRVKKYRNKRKQLGLSSNGYTKHSVTVMERDGNCCVYCGSDNNLCIDHILPTKQGGNDDIENLATACKACNSGKAGRTPEQAGYSFLNKKAESIWIAWMSRNVTVTVTPPEQNRTEQNQNITDKKHTSATFVLPEFINADDWNLWIKTRKGKKLNDQQKQGYVDKLWKWMQDGIDYQSALKDAALAGWQGLHEPKTKFVSRSDRDKEIADQLTGRSNATTFLG